MFDAIVWLKRTAIVMAMVVGNAPVARSADYDVVVYGGTSAAVIAAAAVLAIRLPEPRRR